MKGSNSAPKEIKIALAGNPNVGKSTVFNALTGLHQHTGNWSGKTVDCAVGEYRYKNDRYVLYDLPGCYTVHGGAGEERIARDFILNEAPVAVVTVCDATCLERTLILALQIIESGLNAVICVNLMDEAERNGIKLDLNGLSAELGVQCIGISARSKKGLDELKNAISEACRSDRQNENNICRGCLHGKCEHSRYPEACKHPTVSPDTTAPILKQNPEQAITRAERLAKKYVTTDTKHQKRLTKKLDRIFMGRLGMLSGIILLAVILWITVVGANYPSELLRSLLFGIESKLYRMATEFGMYAPLRDALILGVYRTLAWVISVMLPPMAIFFPLFTLLEDLGYLPRAAFLLDPYLKKCGSCGKQALTMCMGLGCNAVGVSGCRIIDSPRERRIAILTNAFMPCNGRFPTVIMLSAMFCAPIGAAAGTASAIALLGALSLGILLSFTASKLLSVTVLKGDTSAFLLELPPYRPPKVGSVIVRSVLDRTLFVLGRATLVAAPAGLVIWLLGNITVNGTTLLAATSGYLDPFAQIIGLDGVILLAFILGFPANEIVLPIAIMAYSGVGAVTELSTDSLYALLSANGWNTERAICVSLFCLCHFPCSTTLLTVKKETGSWLYTLFAAVIPTVFGIILCFTVHLLFSVFGV